MPHQWLQNVHDKARCPQCGEYEFYRSRARNRWEEFRKEYTHKRPYRCHSCDFRVWIDPVKLNYEYRQSEDTLAIEENPLPVPSFDLGDTADGVVSGVEVPLPYTELRFDEAAPVETPDEAAPVETPDEAAPVETPDETAPVETPDETAPVETPDETAPVETPDEDESDDVWQYHIEFDPNDIQEIRPRRANIDFIPHHHRPRHGRKCPACGCQTLFRSHSKNLTERVRKKITSRRVYRCHNCDWRGWLS